ncbi:hypothetical protein BLOT_015626 [Blomia tropicalis]|nr:hypothetical protein BLOT_015626 [Blomia tropicalis]
MEYLLFNIFHVFDLNKEEKEKKQEEQEDTKIISPLIVEALIYSIVATANIEWTQLGSVDN